jgi:hypothetical protein
MLKLLYTTLVGVGFLVACGGSASRDRHDSAPTSASGDAGEHSRSTEEDAGQGGTASAGAVGPVGPVGPRGGASASGGSNPEELGGMDGGGAAPTLPLPPGCEPRAHSETADSCSLGVYCDTTSQLTNCHRLANSERWQCQCENRDPVYQMENTAGLQACALAASLCSEDELHVGEESCEPTREDRSANGCQIDLACGKPIELEPGTTARAWLMRLGSASCERAESGKSFQCGCAYGDLASDYDLVVDSGAPDCRPLVDFCMSGAPPDGEEQCLLTNAVSSSEGCERSEVCASSMPLSGDVSLARVEPRYANCVPLAGGGSECYCSDRDSLFRFRLPEAPDAASCESSTLNCDADAVIEATGDPSCQPDSATAYSDSCDADLSCVQDATVDDREIVAEGRLLVACARVEPGMPWWCSCASDQETARFPLNAAELSAWQACDQAPAGCLEQLSVHVGPYGELVPPPDALP